MPQQRDKRPLRNILQSTLGITSMPRNILVLEQASIDEVLVQMVRDLGCEAEIEAIDASLAQRGTEAKTDQFAEDAAEPDTNAL